MSNKTTTVTAMIEDGASFSKGGYIFVRDINKAFNLNSPKNAYNRIWQHRLDRNIIKVGTERPEGCGRALAAWTANDLGSNVTDYLNYPPFKPMALATPRQRIGAVQHYLKGDARLLKEFTYSKEPATPRALGSYENLKSYLDVLINLEEGRNHSLQEREDTLLSLRLNKIADEWHHVDMAKHVA